MPFNSQQWAEDHEARDLERFKSVNDNIANVWKVLGVAGVTLITLLGWSLNTQYDAMRAQTASAQEQLQAIRAVQAEVSKPSK